MQHRHLVAQHDDLDCQTVLLLPREAISWRTRTNRTTEPCRIIIVGPLDQKSWQAPPDGVLCTHRFAELTTKKIRRGAHLSVRALETDIRSWIGTWNDDPRPYVWTKTADQTLASLARYCERVSATAQAAAGK